MRRFWPCFLISMALQHPAVGQTAGSAQNITHEYRECFYFSSAAQLKAQPNSPDLSMIGEQAFQACLSEERALRLTIATHTTTISPQMIDAIVLKIKLDLKRTLHDIAKNPRKYM